MLAITLRNALVATFMLGGFMVPLAPSSASAQEAAASAHQLTAFDGSVPVDQITREQLGQEVVFHGVVGEVMGSPAPNVPTRVPVIGESGSPVVTLVYWKDGAEAIEGASGLPKAGIGVAVRGKLEDFRGSLQVKLREPAQVRMQGYPHLDNAVLGQASAPAAQAATVAAPAPALPDDGYYTEDHFPALKSALLGQVVSVRATSTAFRAAWSESSPHTVTFGAAPNTLDVVYWDDTPGPFAEVGQMVYVTGRLQEYQGRFQMRTENMSSLSTQPLPESMLARANPARATSAVGPATTWPGFEKRTSVPAVEAVKLEDYTKVSLRSISSAHVGNKVTIEGKVVSLMAEGTGGAARLEGDRGFVVVKVDAAGLERMRVGQEVAMRGELQWDEIRRQVVFVPTEREYIVGN